MHSNTQAWILPIWTSRTASSNKESATNDFWYKPTKDHPFNGAVSAENNCDYNRQKCKHSTAAITLHETTKYFITAYQGRTEAQEIQTEIDCNTTTPEVQDKVVQIQTDRLMGHIIIVMLARPIT